MQVRAELNELLRLPVIAEEVRVDRSWGDRVHVDAFRAELFREDAYELVGRALGSAVQ